jgi:AmmeMemoRadiSam system protein B
VDDSIGWLSWLSLLAPAAAMMRSRGGPRVVGPAVAGTWYPADPAALGDQVERYLAAPERDPRGRVLALIEPHAGFVYSGAVAGRGFGLVRGSRYSRVILLGPSHYHGFRGAAVPEADLYRTPLGDVDLDRDAVMTLAGSPGFRSFTEAFGPEHSLEAEIPFLQRALEPGWRLVPVLIGGGSSRETAQQIADTLGPLRDGSTLVVVSSDFTHYGPRFGYVPFHADIQDRLRDLDLGAVREIESGDPIRFEEYVESTGATICGRDAIDVLMRLMPDDARASLVNYDTSGKMTGDWDHSVSYASLVYEES